MFGHEDYRATPSGPLALAEALEAAGFVVMRLDCSGTGDSAGDVGNVHDADVWLGDVQRAVDVVRSTGVSKVGLVGFHVGAVLAGEAALARQVDALVLWDPSESGRSFVREQRMLGSAVGPIDDPYLPATARRSGSSGPTAPQVVARRFSCIPAAPDEFLMIPAPAIVKQYAAIAMRWLSAPIFLGAYRFGPWRRGLRRWTASGVG